MDIVFSKLCFSSRLTLQSERAETHVLIQVRSLLERSANALFTDSDSVVVGTHATLASHVYVLRADSNLAFWLGSTPPKSERPLQKSLMPKAALRKLRFPGSVLSAQRCLSDVSSIRTRMNNIE